MFEVLGKFNLATDFIICVQTLYCAPTACVIINGLLFLPLPLGRGRRQSCPLSPLLFTLILEALAEISH